VSTPSRHCRRAHFAVVVHDKHTARLLFRPRSVRPQVRLVIGYAATTCQSATESETSSYGQWSCPASAISRSSPHLVGLLRTSSPGPRLAVCLSSFCQSGQDHSERLTPVQPSRQGQRSRLDRKILLSLASAKSEHDQYVGQRCFEAGTRRSAVGRLARLTVSTGESVGLHSPGTRGSSGPGGTSGPSKHLCPTY
jgi:hypothetical protein